MKNKLLLLFCLCALFTTAQPTFDHTITGLPQDVHAAIENVQFNNITNQVIKITPTTSRTVKNGVTTITNGVSITWAAPKVQTNTGNYGLNFMQGEIYEYGMQYVNPNDSGFVFFKAAKQTAVGYMGWAKGNLHRKGNTWIYERIAEMPAQFTYYRNQQLQYISREEVLAKLKITQAQYEYKARMIFSGVIVDPSTHITSVFPYFTLDTLTGQAINYTFINGKQWNTINYGSLKTFYGKTGLSYVWRWVLYNGCDLTDNPKAQAHLYYGNFGQCIYNQFDRTDTYAVSPKFILGTKGYSASTNTYRYDPSEEYVVITLELEELPAQGKNFKPIGHYVLKGCDIDDNCGWWYRLPRKPYVVE